MLDKNMLKGLADGKGLSSMKNGLLLIACLGAPISGWSAPDAPENPRNFIYLGLHGEFVVPMHNSPPFMWGALEIRPSDEGMSFYDVKDKTLVGAVAKDGQISMLKTKVSDVEDFTQMPLSLNLDPEKGGQPYFRPGVVLARRADDGGKTVPEGTVGWVVQLTDRSIFMPLQDSPKPELFLWIIEDEGGGFSFVHNGVRDDGVLLAVDDAYKISYGPSSKYYEESLGQQKYWPYRFYEGSEEVAMSEGTVVHESGEDKPNEYMRFKNGIPDAWHSSR